MGKEGWLRFADGVVCSVKVLFLKELILILSEQPQPTAATSLHPIFGRLPHFAGRVVKGWKDTTTPSAEAAATPPLKGGELFYKPPRLRSGIHLTFERGEFFISQSGSISTSRLSFGGLPPVR